MCPHPSVSHFLGPPEPHLPSALKRQQHHCDAKLFAASSALLKEVQSPLWNVLLMVFKLVTRGAVQRRHIVIFLFIVKSNHGFRNYTRRHKRSRSSKCLPNQLQMSHCVSSNVCIMFKQHSKTNSTQNTSIKRIHDFKVNVLKENNVL